MTSPSVYHQIMQAPDKYTEIQSLRAHHNPAVTANIPTNIDLWFQVLPGTVS